MENYYSALSIVLEHNNCYLTPEAIKDWKWLSNKWPSVTLENGNLKIMSGDLRKDFLFPLSDQFGIENPIEWKNNRFNYSIVTKLKKGGFDEFISKDLFNYGKILGYNVYLTTNIQITPKNTKEIDNTTIQLYLSNNKISVKEYSDRRGTTILSGGHKDIGEWEMPPNAFQQFLDNLYLALIEHYNIICD